MFGIGGTELLVIIVVALIVFGPKDLPKAMRSAGAMMRTFNRVSGEYRRQFEQALRDVEREVEIEETRKSVEAALKDSPTPVKSPPGQKDQGDDSKRSPAVADPEPGERASSEAKEKLGHA
ncbi:Sec-independent protein translocase protein TatB [Nitratireductor soli]|uniref:Sec-independent protein translocase protein TatB n=1 Tax=Nitratireductor soli TaxID=1670619 RepID=UPI00069F9BD7|nr:Sec-independent protein translocase protein TatB [Nitratireductor soli]